MGQSQNLKTKTCLPQSMRLRLRLGFSLARAFLIATLEICLFAGLAFATQGLTSEALEHMSARARTRQAALVLADLESAESSLCNFCLTRSPRFEARYNERLQQIDGDVETFIAAHSATPESASSCQSLRNLKTYLVYDNPLILEETEVDGAYKRNCNRLRFAFERLEDLGWQISQEIALLDGKDKLLVDCCMKCSAIRDQPGLWIIHADWRVPFIDGLLLWLLVHIALVMFYPGGATDRRLRYLSHSGIRGVIERILTNWGAPTVLG
jgi:hypothetical protein